MGKHSGYKYILVSPAQALVFLIQTMNDKKKKSRPRNVWWYQTASICIQTDVTFKHSCAFYVPDLCVILVVFGVFAAVGSFGDTVTILVEFMSTLSIATKETTPLPITLRLIGPGVGEVRSYL